MKEEKKSEKTKVLYQKDTVLKQMIGQIESKKEEKKDGEEKKDDEKKDEEKKDEEKKVLY